MFNEAELQKRLKWQSIKEIPEFPFKTFEQARSEILNGNYGIAVDNTKANAISDYVRTKLGVFWSILLSWVPWLCIFASLIISLLFSKWEFLWGILFSIAALLLANPYGFFKVLRNRFGDTVDVLFVVLAGIVMYFLFVDGALSLSLFALFLCSYVANRTYYIGNEKAVTQAALESEPLFIYLYQDGNLGLKDNQTGSIYWNLELNGDLSNHLMRKTRF